MKNILNSIKNHPQQDEILKQIRYGQSRQEYLRPLFQAFIELLDNENIPYSIAFGTLLGCIRHGMEIPWDDDYDIHILKKHAKLLLSLNLPKLDKTKTVFPDFGKKKKIISAYKIEVKKNSDENHLFFVKTPWNFIQVFLCKGMNEKPVKILDIFHERWLGKKWITEKSMFPLLKKQMSGMTVCVMNDWENYLPKRFSNKWKNECIVSNHTIETVFKGKNEKLISFELKEMD